MKVYSRQGHVYTLIVIWMVMNGAEAVDLSSVKQSVVPTSQLNLNIDKTGTKSGEPIDSGFAFFDGHYIDAPYIVSRRGVAVFINDTMVEPPHEIPDQAALSGDKDPAIPSVITRLTSQHDAATTDYLKRKVAYAHKHLSLTEERRYIEEAIRALPSTKTASLDPKDKNLLHVITYNGEEHPYYLLSPRRQSARTVADVVQQLDGYCNHLETLLNKGACIFFSRTGSRTMLSSRDAAQQLARIVPILRSSKPDDQKFLEIRASGLRQISPDNFPKIITQFSASPQLEARLREQEPK